MSAINEQFQKLPGNYLFTEIARRMAAYSGQFELIRLGIGDVRLPLPKAVTAAMIYAAEEMGTQAGFHGYGPEQGYPFLRRTIAKEDYQKRGVEIQPSEIFVSDGAKSDCGGLLELFDRSAVVAVCDPVYPAYVDAAVMGGQAGDYDSISGRWSRLYYLNAVKEKDFIVDVPTEKVDVVYLCYPNNPTGVAATRENLQEWVDYANDCGAVIIYDGAYEAYITEPELPHSIYEIPGAKACAVELRSFSKTAGFTGVRCAYAVIPDELVRNGQHLSHMWSRRQAARFNGVSYVTQRGAEAVYSERGMAEVQAHLRHYGDNALRLADGLRKCGLSVWGGVNAPYIWVETPEHIPSWNFFEFLLQRAGVVTTPGVGFGPSGEGFLRLTAFCDKQDVAAALERIRRIL